MQRKLDDYRKENESTSLGVLSSDISETELLELFDTLDARKEASPLYVTELGRCRGIVKCGASLLERLRCCQFATNVASLEVQAPVYEYK